MFLAEANMFWIDPRRTHLTFRELAQTQAQVRATCSRGHVRLWSAADLQGRPGMATLGAFARDLQCKRCGSTLGVVGLPAGAP
jgi:hypothetical protein